MAPYDEDLSGSLDFPEFLHFLKDASAAFERKFVVDEEAGGAPGARLVTDWDAPRERGPGT